MYLTQMLKLEADESALAVERIAVGSGTVDEDNQRAIRARWEGQASKVRRRVRPTTPPNPAALAAMGIGFRGP